MAYVDYIPTEVTLYAPRIDEYLTPSPNTNNYITRSLYSNHNIIDSIGYIGTLLDTTAQDVVDNFISIGASAAEAIEYENNHTYHTNNYVLDSVTKLIYRYAGLDPLVLTSLIDWETYHPSRKSFNGSRTNSDIWVIYGTENRYKHLSASTKDIRGWLDTDQTSLRTSADSNNITNVIPINKITFWQNQTIALFGLNNVDRVVIHSRKNGETVQLIDLDFSYKTKLYLNSKLVSPANEYIDIYLMGASTYAPSTTANINDTAPQIGTLVRYDASQNYVIGSSLYGHLQNRVSEFKTVISDGVEKSMVTKSYDVFSGNVLVDADNLQKAEYALAKATQGDYVFHIGSGRELYDQRVYLGHIKYSSPIKTPSNKYKIQISGQSLAYGVENPLIAPDSTDGYAQ